MQLELKISQETNPDYRREVKIEVILDEKEKQHEEEGWQHLCCQTPVSFQIFMKENPEVRTVADHAYMDGKPLKIYFLPKAPKALMNRPIPRKTALKIPARGCTTLGFINPKDVNLLKEWWEKSKNEFLIKQSPKHQAQNEVKKEFQTIGRSQKTHEPNNKRQNQLSTSVRRSINILD